MTSVRDVVVVGGGIAGAWTAWALANAGRKVCVLSSRQPAAATWAAAGILFCIRDWADDQSWGCGQFALEGSQQYPLLCARLPNTGFECRGLLSIGTEAVGLADWAARHGLVCETLTPAQCHQRYPQLRAPQAPATYLPQITQIDPRRFIGAFWEYLCHEKEVELHDVRIDSLRSKGSELWHLFEAGKSEDEWLAKQVVMAAGAWSGQVNLDSSPLNISPRKGQIAVWEGVEVGDLPIVLEGLHYLVPRENGEVLVGATDEDAGFSTETTESAYEELTGFARHWCPELLAAAPVKQRVGLRPMEKSGQLRVDEDADCQNLFYHVGHYRHGIVCAPATALYLQDRMAETLRL